MLILVTSGSVVVTVQLKFWQWKVAGSRYVVTQPRPANNDRWGGSGTSRLKEKGCERRRPPRSGSHGMGWWNRPVPHAGITPHMWADSGRCRYGGGNPVLVYNVPNGAGVRCGRCGKVWAVAGRVQSRRCPGLNAGANVVGGNVTQRCRVCSGGSNQPSEPGKCRKKPFNHPNVQQRPVADHPKR